MLGRGTAGRKAPTQIGCAWRIALSPRAGAVKTYAAYGFLPEATVEVDGKAVVEKGVLKVAR